MFLYWEGFEIDGSDTDFDIVLPESIQVYEFVDCFLSIPLFTNIIEPSIIFHANNKKYEVNREELIEKLFAGDQPNISIMINCMHLEQLPNDLRNKIYAISERREPHESAYGESENPCTAPVIQKSYDRGGMTVKLEMQIPSEDNWYGKDWFSDEGDLPDGLTDGCGYIQNYELLSSIKPELCYFSINVGPGFYYEYAMFIIDYLRDRFPGLGIGGGLDCGGGWTHGCTYADSIYRYEKIQLPIKYSVKNILKRLTEYDIIRSYKSYYNNGWKYEYPNGFILANVVPLKYDSIKPISFPEYIVLVESVLSQQSDSFDKICDTATKIILPFAEVYAENPKAVKILQASLPHLNKWNKEWYFTGFLSFTTAEGNPVCELRVNYLMKKYLLTLLGLMDSDSGMIDFIKSETYKRRNV